MLNSAIELKAKFEEELNEINKFENGMYFSFIKLFVFLI